MRGLLLKDFYMMKKYCRTYLLIAIVFSVISLVGKDNMFFVFYPCLLCGMIPVSLLGYDERSRWLQYSESLPYTKEQIVSCKYLIGLLVQVVMLIVTAILQAVKMNINGTFDWKDFIVLMLLVMIMAAITSSISLPFMFKLGVEKGRAAYYVMVGAVCVGSIIFSGLFLSGGETEIELSVGLFLLCLVGIGLYALSWYLSVLFYKRREL